MSDNEITNSRVLNYPRELVWRAWSEAEHLKMWWGPKGFRNTFYEFNFREGGDWKFVMHGPDGKNYDNYSQFIEIKKPERIVLKHACPPIFVATATFEDLGRQTQATFHAVFEMTINDELRKFLFEANEQNFDRIEAELKRMTFQSLSDKLCP